MPLFQLSVLKKHLQELDNSKIDIAFDKFNKHFADLKIQENIRNLKEEQYQEGFIRELFVDVLGYILSPQENFNIITEFKNIKDSKKADAAILLNSTDVIAVIELKGTDTTDLSKVEVQAFSYKTNQKNCTYVITSNFEKLRFYIDNAIDFEEFNLFSLTKERFRTLYLCLASENLLNGIPQKIKNASISEEENITKKLYTDYSSFKNTLFRNLTQLNPQFDKLTLFKKTQKLLDRFLFVFFAEDRNLLPPNSIRQILNHWEQLKDLDSYNPLYDRFKKYFGYMNTGIKSNQYDIFAYNGGLFAPDKILDSIKIDDNILYQHTIKLSNYDFDTEVDVNILGHIFEHSLNEIEEIQAELEGKTVDKSKSKRKKDGVFYTPKYITKYIVENTVGSLCTDKKKDLEINDDEIIISNRKSKKKELLAKIDEYRNWLLNLKICDPACGSGAFLNQALDFLISEHRKLDELIARITNSTLILSDIENSILENNIFGVDLNEEAVEIARLSLWLKTAQKGRKLSNLSSNIKCGNSLIDDPSVAGDKAFNWFLEFPQVFPHYRKPKPEPVIPEPESGDKDYLDELQEPSYSYKSGTKGFEKYGFDIIIGNPPYVDIKGLPNDIVSYFFKKFKTAENRINLYSLFIEQAYTLIKSNGLLSFINPNSMLVNSSYKKLRISLIDDLKKIVKLPDNVFLEAKVETIILEVQKDSNNDLIKAIIYPNNETITFIDDSITTEFSKSIWKNQDDVSFNIYSTNIENKILVKIEKDSVSLETLADFSLGITPYDKYKGHSEDIIKNRAFHSLQKLDETYKPLITGENITRYFTLPKINEYIKYGEWLGAMRDERFFTEPRILIRQIVSGKPLRIYASFTDKSYYFTQIGFGIISKDNKKLNPNYLLSLLNSSLLNFYHSYKYLDLEKNLFQKILIANCRRFPIKVISENEQQKFVTEVDKLIILNQKLYELKTKFLKLLTSKYNDLKISNKLENWHTLSFKDFLKDLDKQKIKLSLSEQAEWMSYFESEKENALKIQEEIKQTDDAIDQMIYSLYGLEKDEILIIDPNFKN